MDIPTTVYNIANSFVYISIGLEGVSIIILGIAVFVGDFNVKTAVARDFYKSGSRIRNTILCLLIFLFLIAKRGMRIGELSVLAAISSVCSRFAYCSVYVFCASILLSIIAVIMKARLSDTQELIKHIERSSTCSILIGYLLAYFLYIP